MKKKKNCLLLVVILLILAGCNSGSKEYSDDSNTVKVIIDYGDQKPIKEIVVNWKDGFTALRALQHAASVSSYPVGQYVFVTEIDSVRGERGVMGWYYTVNGEPTGTIAINNVVSPDDEIRWIYREDVCSPK